MSQVDPHYPHHRELQGISLDQFLSHPKLPWIARGNRQIGHLLMEHVSKESPPPLHERYDFIREKLQDYALVGIHEDLPSSLQLLAHVFGWYCGEEVPHFNKSKMHAFALTAAQQARVEELTQLDRKLYDWVRSRFDQRYRQLVHLSGLSPDDKSQASRSALCAAINRASERRREVRLSRPDWRGHIEVINCEGFHLCHLDRHRQRQIQWIGPAPRAQVTLGFTTPADHLLCVEVVHSLTSRMLDDFRVSINGRPIRLEKRPVGDSSWSFVGEVPKKLIERSVHSTEIVLETSSVSSPRALNLNATDDEVKCLALGSLQLLPGSSLHAPVITPSHASIASALSAVT
jgi:hypothetical protein